MGVPVSKVMVKRVITCDVSVTLQAASKVMKNKKIGCLIITKNKKPVGILTEVDITYKGMAENLDGTKVQVQKIMSSPLKMISPNQDVYYAENMMNKNKIKKLPVIKSGKMVGILTQTDIIDYFTKQRKTLALERFKKELKSIK